MFRILLTCAFLVETQASIINRYDRVLTSSAGAAQPSPIPPKDDPWYTAPEGYEIAQPGSVLRFRKAPGNLTDTLNASSAVYNILYRTTNSRYQPAWAVTTVFVPLEVDTSSNKTASLLSYQTPYNTANINASPSFLLYSPSFANALVLSDVQSSLSRGWYVSIPDFEGPTASFASGVSEGHAVIDSVRAALTLTPGARTALWGYSGGSIASEWAGELAVQYAPELDFAGMAIGGVGPNITDLVANIDGTPAAWLVPALILGITNQYPDATEYIMSNLKKSGPSNITGFLATRNYSGDQLIAAYSNQSILNDYFIGGNATIYDSPLIRQVFNRDGQMGYHGVPNLPLYVYKAIEDEYSATKYTDALVQRYCEVGANITYKRNRRGHHIDEYINGDPGAFEWLTQILDGSGSSNNTGVQAGCSIQNVTVGTQDNPPFYFPPQ